MIRNSICTVSGLLALALAGASPLAEAQPIQKPIVYAGLGGGIVLGDDMATLLGEFRGSSNIERDGTGTAWTAFGGIKIKDYAVEAGYLGRTREEIGLQGGTSGSQKVSIKRTTFYVAGAADIKLDLKKPGFMKKLKPYAKVGLAWWNIDITDEKASRGWDPLVGLGTSFKLSKLIDIRAEALIVLSDDARISDDQHFFLVSGCVKF